MNNRRKLLVALGAGPFGTPLASFAQQQGKIWRVGVLSQRQVAISETDYYYGPFRQGMRELGYVEGKNLLIEWRSAEGKYERVPDLATELANLKVDVIVAAGGPTHRAAQKATTVIPTVIVRRGSGRHGFGQELGAPRRQHHRALEPQCGHQSQAPGDAAQHGAQALACSCIGES